ncbi:hypothetical protein LXL04_023372 [Taraxacum kok-saghyz]
MKSRVCGHYKEIKNENKWRYKYIWPKYGDKKNNCPFELVGIYYKTYDFWTLTVKNGEHNHDP